MDKLANTDPLDSCSAVNLCCSPMSAGEQLCGSKHTYPFDARLQYERFSHRLASLLNNAAVMLHTVQDYEGAMSYYRQAVHVRVEAQTVHENIIKSQTELRKDSAFVAARCNEVTVQIAQVSENLDESLVNAENDSTRSHAVQDIFEQSRTIRDSLSLEFLLSEHGDQSCCQSTLLVRGNMRLSRPWRTQTEEMGKRNACLEGNLSDENESSSITLYNMGLLHYEMNDLDKAAKLFEMALSLLSNASSTHTSYCFLKATIYNNIAQILYKTNEMKGSLKSYAQALLCQKIHQHSDYGESMYPLPDRAAHIGCLCSTLVGIARIHFRCGNFNEARKVCIEHMRLVREEYGDSHIDVAASLYNMGMIALACGDRDTAIECTQSFVQRAHGFLGDNVQVATALYSIGVMLAQSSQEDDLDSSLCHLLDALRMRRTLLGDSHSEVADTLYQLGQNCSRRGLSDDAILYYSHALNIKKNVFQLMRETGEDVGAEKVVSRDIITILCSLAEERAKLGQIDESLKSYHDAFILTAAEDDGLYKNHISSWLLVSMGKLHLERDETDAALELFTDAHQLCVDSFVDDSDLVLVLRILADAGNTKTHHAAAA